MYCESMLITFSGVKMLFLSSKTFPECLGDTLFFSRNNDVLFTLSLTKNRWIFKVMIARALHES